MPDFDLRHILLVVYLLLVGSGAYITFVQQGQTIDALTQSIDATEDRWADLTALREKAARLDRQAAQGGVPRHERYKVIPDTMSTARLMGYLTALTQTGFHAFDLGTKGSRKEAGYRVYTMTAEGRASFRRLYHFVWTLENDRPFYRLRALELATVDERSTDEETGRTTMDVLVSFRMDVEAIYGLAGRRSRPETDERDRFSIARTDSQPPVPVRVLPASEPPSDPFHPLVFEQVPPNEHGRLNVEEARFLSIVRGQAVFKTDQGLVRRGVGDRVYLGRIIDIDPAAGRLVARLDKGGVVERVERTLGSDEPTTQPNRP